MYPYKELDNVRWLTKRQGIMARDQFKCTKCGTTEQLQVHHLYYTSGYHLWDYPDASLVTFCSDCHEQWHQQYGVWYRDSTPVVRSKARKPKRVSPAKARRKLILQFGFKGKEVGLIYKRTKTLSSKELEQYLKQSEMLRSIRQR